MTSWLETWRAQSRLAREGWLLLTMLGLGLLALPPAVYFTGLEVLGPYQNGGLFRFWGDFFLGLTRGDLPWWLLALGPYAFVLFIRAARLGWRLSARV